MRPTRSPFVRATSASLLTVCLCALSSVVNAQSFTIDPPSPQNGALFGTSVSLIDDLDGDGRPDLVIGSPNYDHDVDGDTIADSNVGRVDIISGGTGAVLLTVFGTQAGALFGRSVAGGGDTDGDGIPDFAVGAPEFDNAGNLATGAAWILRGSDGAVLFELLGTLQNEFVGQTVAYLGNLPRDDTQGPDTFGDFGIGVPSSNFIPSRRVVIAGHTMDSPTTSAMSTESINDPWGGNNGLQFGAAVAGLDFDGDGTPDVAIGAPSARSTEGFNQRGRVVVYSGVNLTSQLFFRDGKQNNNQRFGTALANAGDFDGAPGDELAIGSRGYVPSGGASGSGALDVYARTPGSSLGALRLRIEGIEGNAQFGASISTAGDVDGDGFADLLVGQAGPTSTNLGGNAYVISGSNVDTTESLGGARTIFDASTEVTIFAGDSLGNSGLAGGADTDGDGQAEILIAAVNRNSVGQILAFQSGPPPPDPALSEVTVDEAIITSYGGLATITVTPRDANGTLLGAGQAASLSTTGGTLVGSIIDHGDGTYSQDLEGTTAVDFGEVTATVNGVALDTTILVSFVDVDPGTSTVEIDATSGFVGAIRTITVTPRDDTGAAVGPGRFVTIDATIGDLIGTPEDLGDGTYEQTYEATMVGTASITATVDGLALANSASFNVTDPADVGQVIGAEADDTLHSYASIQEAVDASAADNVTTIFIAPGAYAETVRIKNLSGLTLEGLSAQDPVVLDGFRMVASSNITLRNIEVDASFTNKPGVLVRGRSVSNSDIVLENLSVHGTNNNRDGVLVRRGNGPVTIVDCHIYDNARHGITLRRESGPHFISDNLIELNGANGVRIAREVTATLSSNTIRDNGVLTNQAARRYGISLRRSPGGGSPELITLIQNTLTGNGGKVINGRADAEIKNFDQIIDPTDDQPGY